MSLHQRASLLKSPPYFCIRIIEVAKHQTASKKYFGSNFSNQRTRWISFCETCLWYERPSFHEEARYGNISCIALYLNCSLIKASLPFCITIVIECHLLIPGEEIIHSQYLFNQTSIDLFMHSSKVKWKQRTTLKFNVSAQTTLWCKPQPLKIPFVSAYNQRNAKDNNLVKMAIVSANEVKKSPTWRLELERDGYTVQEGVLSQSEVEVARLVTNHLWSMCQKRDFCSREISGGWSRKS